MNSDYLNLPLELKWRIADFLSWQDIKNLRLTCKSQNVWINDFLPAKLKNESSRLCELRLKKIGFCQPTRLLTILIKKADTIQNHEIKINCLIFIKKMTDNFDISENGCVKIKDISLETFNSNLDKVMTTKEMDVNWKTELVSANYFFFSVNYDKEKMDNAIIETNKHELSFEKLHAVLSKYDIV